jgi:hypothetical protein
MSENETFEVSSYVAICALCALGHKVTRIEAKQARNQRSKYLAYYFEKTPEAIEDFNSYVYNRVLTIEIHDFRAAMEDFREQRRRLIEHGETS